MADIVTLITGIQTVMELTVAVAIDPAGNWTAQAVNDRRVVHSRDGATAYDAVSALAEAIEGECADEANRLGGELEEVEARYLRLRSIINGEEA